MNDYTDLFGQFVQPVSNAEYSAISIAVSSTLVWPANYSGSIANEYPATTLIEITSTAGLSVNLPPGQLVSVGAEVIVRNAGANTLTILDADGGAVTTLESGVVKYFFVKDDAGTWGIFTFGTGTSGADAVMLAGYGLEASANKLMLTTPYRGLNSDYTVQTLDRAQVVNVSAGSIVVTLLPVATATEGFYFLFRNSTSSSATVVADSVELIDGFTSKTFAPGESAIIICSGTDWICVGFGQSSEFAFSEVVVNAAAGNATLTANDVSGRMIRVSGTATANIVITIPAVDGIYFLNIEPGMGAFTCTFTTGTGLTTVLSASQKTVVYCDGSNVSPAITTTVTASLSLVDGNAAAPSIAFALDTDTGFFRSANGIIGVASNGVATMYFNGNGIVFTPVGNITATNVFAALAQLDGFITANGGAITTLAGRVTTAEGNITTLQGQMTTAQSNISALQTTRETKWTIVNRAVSGSMAVDEKAYVSADGVTLQLPAAMTAGQKVAFVILADVSGTVIAANGNVIQGLVDDVEIDVYPHTREVELVYVNATVGGVFQ